MINVDHRFFNPRRFKSALGNALCYIPLTRQTRFDAPDGRGKVKGLSTRAVMSSKV